MVLLGGTAQALCGGAAAGGVLLSAPVAAAQAAPVAVEQAEPAPAPVRRSAERHGASLLLELGWYDGLVGGLQLDAGVIGFRASAGYFPIVLLVSDDTLSTADGFDLEVINSVQANGELLWFFHATGEKSRIGLSLGYHFNTVLEHGVGLAFQGEGALSDSVVIYYTFGLAIFWRGNARAREELELPDASFNFPFGAGFQGGGGVGLRFPL